MAISYIKQWVPLEILYSADLNAEFNNIYSGGVAIISPLKAGETLDLDGKELILDAAGNASITADTPNQVDMKVNSVDLFVFDATEASSVNGIEFVAKASGSNPYITTVGENNIDLELRPETTSGTVILADDAGDEILIADGSGTPVNEIKITSADSGDRPIIAASGDGTDTDVGIDFENEQGEGLLDLIPVASGVNNVEIVNAASGGGPIIRASDDDLNLDAASGDRVVVRDSSGNEIAIFDSVASALNEIEIKNAATGENASIGASGQFNRGIDFLDSNGDEIATLESVASAVNELTITNAITNEGPLISAEGETNVDVRLQGKGTGQVKLGDAELPFPDADGTNDGDALITDSSGTLSFGKPAFPRGHIMGLDIVSEASLSLFSVEKGECRGGGDSDEDDVNIFVTSEYTKRLDLEWTSGDLGGAVPNNIFPLTATNTEIHVFALGDGSTGFDIAVDTSIDAANILLDTDIVTTANLDYFRRIGSLHIGATADEHLRATYDDGRVTFRQPIQILSTTSPSGTGADIVARTPIGIKATGIFNIAGDVSSDDSLILYPDNLGAASAASAVITASNFRADQNYSVGATTQLLCGVGIDGDVSYKVGTPGDWNQDNGLEIGLQGYIESRGRNGR